VGIEERVAASGGDVLDTSRAGHLVIQGGLLRGAGFVASTLLALLGIALVTRHLGVADFGRFQTVLSLITIVGTVTDAGMAMLGLREFAQRTGDDRERLMEALLGLRLVLTVIGAALAAAIAVAVGYDWELVLGTALAGIGLALTVVQTTLTIPLAVEMRNAAFTGLDLLRQLLTVAGYAALVALGAGVVAFLGVTVPVGIAMVVAAAVLVRGQVPLRPAFRPAEWGRLARTAAAFAMATAVGTIYLYTAQVLTAVVTDARDTGLFSASFRVFMVGAMIPGTLVAVAFPLLARAARDDTHRLAYAVQRLLDTTAILGFGVALGLVVGAPVVIDVMAGPSFADAVPVLRIHAVTLVATFLVSPIGFALLSLHAHREVIVANLIALVVTLAAVASLATAMGPEGAALGTVIGESTLAVAYFVALRRTEPAVLPDGRRAGRAAVAAVAAVAFALIPGLSAWIACPLALIAYAGLLMLLKAVPEELLELVPRRMPRS
jgi:O-antigen/teichoic acid export membrane protein